MFHLPTDGESISLQGTLTLGFSPHEKIEGETPCFFGWCRTVMLFPQNPSLSISRHHQQIGKAQRRNERPVCHQQTQKPIQSFSCSKQKQKNLYSQTSVYKSFHVFLATMCSQDWDQPFQIKECPHHKCFQRVVFRQMAEIIRLDPNSFFTAGEKRGHFKKSRLGILRPAWT